MRISDWSSDVCSSDLFDAMGALSSGYNDRPTLASRAYDRDRDGFVISGGGGVVVLEELEHARARGARIYGEEIGRASCRESVSVRVDIGGRRIIKKKNNYN